VHDAATADTKHHDEVGQLACSQVHKTRQRRRGRTGTHDVPDSVIMCWVIKPLCKALPVIICWHLCAHVRHAIHLATKPLLDLLQCVWATLGSRVVHHPSVRGALQSHREVTIGDAALAEHDGLECEADLL